MVTVAVRRINITDKRPMLSDYLNPKKLFFYQIPQDALAQKKL